MKKLFAIMTFALCAALFCACNDDNSTSWPVPQPVVETLYDKYPTASHIRWYHSGAYAVAEFRTSQNNVAQRRWAWFDAAGTWYMTETDATLAQMPQAVQTAFRQSSYASWEVEQGDLLERAGLDDLYAIRIEDRSRTRNDDEAVLFYTADGKMVRKLTDPADDYRYGDMLPVPLPASVSAFIQSQYPGAQLIASGFGDNVTRVEILDDGVVRTLWFDGGDDWLYTVTPVSYRSLPDAVAAAFAESEYARYTVLDTLYYNTPAGDYYRLILQSGTQTVEIDITPDGTIAANR